MEAHVIVHLIEQTLTNVSKNNNKNTRNEQKTAEQIKKKLPPPKSILSVCIKPIS